MTGNRGFIRDKNGTAATEFALIAPVLFFLLAGIYDYASYINYSMRLTDTTRAAAQYVVNGGNPDYVQSDVIQPSNLGNQSAVTVNTEYVCRCDSGEEISCDGSCGINTYERKYIEVTLGANYSAPVNFPGILSSMPMQSFVRIQVQ